MSSNKINEFWSTLLEKAYAKLYGSYEALEAGCTSEAFVDLTGGIAERFDLKKNDVNLLDVIKKAFDNNSIIGCSINHYSNGDEKRNGLIGGHAYSMTKALRYTTTLLLRIRNPWGRVEWDGPWSDKSSEWTNISEFKRREIGLNFEEDGEFWICLSDFVKHFDKMEICHLSPDLLTDQCRNGNQWKIENFEGENSNNCPGYVVEMRKPDEKLVIIALIQKNYRSHEKKSSRVGISVKDQSGNEIKPMDGMHKSTTCRGITLRFMLQPGSYLITPSTDKGKFLIRVFTKSCNIFRVK